VAPLPFGSVSVHQRPANRPEATDACDLKDEVLGRQTADEVRRSALLQLTNMGVTLARPAWATEA